MPLAFLMWHVRLLPLCCCVISTTSCLALLWRFCFNDIGSRSRPCVPVELDLPMCAKWRSDVLGIFLLFTHHTDWICQYGSWEKESYIFVGSCLVSVVSSSRTVHTERTLLHPQEAITAFCAPGFSTMKVVATGRLRSMTDGPNYWRRRTNQRYSFFTDPVENRSSDLVCSAGTNVLTHCWAMRGGPASPAQWQGSGFFQTFRWGRAQKTVEIPVDVSITTIQRRVPADQENREGGGGGAQEQFLEKIADAPVVIQRQAKIYFFMSGWQWMRFCFKDFATKCFGWFFNVICQ